MIFGFYNGIFQFKNVTPLKGNKIDISANLIFAIFSRVASCIRSTRHSCATNSRSRAPAPTAVAVSSSTE